MTFQERDMMTQDSSTTFMIGSKSTATILKWITSILTTGLEQFASNSTKQFFRESYVVSVFVEH